MTSILQVKLALPLMLIAPVLGFCVRCVVDYIHVHINEEVERRYAEMETYQTRHQPKVKRWQNILDGDRNDSPELVGVGAFMTVVSCKHNRPCLHYPSTQTSEIL